MGDNYTQIYDPAEIGEVGIDLGMGILVALVGFAGLIGLVLVYNWFMKKIKGR